MYASELKMYITTGCDDDRNLETPPTTAGTWPLFGETLLDSGRRVELRGLGRSAEKPYRFLAHLLTLPVHSYSR